MTVYVIAQIKFTKEELYRRYQARFFDVFRVPMAKLVVIDGEAGLRLAAAQPVLHARKLPGLRPSVAPAAQRTRLSARRVRRSAP